MEINSISYIQTDHSMILNEACIRWVRKLGDCLEVCTKIDGCNSTNTHQVCKLNSPDSYNKLNSHFTHNPSNMTKD